MEIKDIKKIELEITSNCNAGCPNCVRTIFPDNYSIGSISLSDIKKIFSTKEYISEKIFLLCGQLGDPVINADCYSICKYIVENNGYIIINTNAGLKSAKWWAQLGKLSAESKRLKVWFCVDGYENTNHIYRVDTNFKVIKNNMSSYSAAGGEGVWMFIEFDHAVVDIDQCKKYAKELGFEFSTREPSTEIKSNKINFIPKPNKDAQFSENNITCKFVHEGEIFINYEQKVIPCCFLQRHSIRYPTDFHRAVNPYKENWNSLKHHSLENILHHEWFLHTLKESWDSNHPQHLVSCEYCAVQAEMLWKIKKK